jgi:hypothetical protein
MEPPFAGHGEISLAAWPVARSDDEIVTAAVTMSECHRFPLASASTHDRYNFSQLPAFKILIEFASNSLQV